MRTNTLVAVLGLVTLAFLLPGLVAGIAISAWIFGEGSRLLNIPIWVFVSTFLVLLAANAVMARYGEPGSTEKRVAATAFLIFLPGVVVSFVEGVADSPSIIRQKTAEGSFIKIDALLTGLIPTVVYIACAVAVLICLYAVCAALARRCKK